jgi:hypothetical protein
VVNPLNIPDRTPAAAIPKAVLFKVGRCLDRERTEAPATITPMITLTVVSEKCPRSKAPTGVNTTPKAAMGRKPFNLRFRRKVMKTITFRDRLETAITGTAQRAGTKTHSSGRASSEYPNPLNP